MRLPAQWFVITAAIIGGFLLAAVTLSPSLRYSFQTGWEVRGLLRFRDRFIPERLEIFCPDHRPHRATDCVHEMIRKENRLRFASMTGRIYYLSTVAGVALNAREAGRTTQERVEANLDFLAYLNEEMKAVLVATGGEIDLKPLDSRPSGFGLAEDPEIALRRQYHANVTDLWIHNWRRAEKFLDASERDVDYRTKLWMDAARADRNELFSRLQIDTTRYEKKRVPAGSR